MVTIYTVPNCPKCALLKRKAAEFGVEYTESRDVEKPIKAGLHAAPVLEYEDKFYSLKDALNVLKQLGA